MPAKQLNVEKKRAGANPRAASIPAHPQSPSADALEESVGYSLRRAHVSTYDQFAAAMAPFEVRPAQFAVLVLIQANPGLTQSAICSALGIQKTNFVALLDRLERRGLTERRKAGSDRRTSALHLTRAGETFVKTIEAAHRSMEQQLVKRLGAKRSRELLQLLHEFTREAD